MVVSVGRVCRPLSRRDTTLLVVHILAATSACVIPAATRALTRSVNSVCNVRSVVSERVFRFLRPSVSEARLVARTWEGLYTAEAGAAPERDRNNANSDKRRCPSVVRPNWGRIRADSFPICAPIAVRIIANHTRSGSHHCSRTLVRWTRQWALSRPPRLSLPADCGRTDSGVVCLTIVLLVACQVTLTKTRPWKPLVSPRRAS